MKPTDKRYIRWQYQEAYRIYRTHGVSIAIINLPPIPCLAAEKSLKTRNAFGMLDIEGRADLPAPVEVSRENR